MIAPENAGGLTVALPDRWAGRCDAEPAPGRAGPTSAQGEDRNVVTVTLRRYDYYVAQILALHPGVALTRADATLRPGSNGAAPPSD